MYVCMYVCMYVRTYVCMYVSMHVCIFGRIQSCQRWAYLIMLVRLVTTGHHISVAHKACGSVTMTAYAKTYMSQASTILDTLEQHI